MREGGDGDGSPGNIIHFPQRKETFFIVLTPEAPWFKAPADNAPEETWNTFFNNLERFIAPSVVQGMSRTQSLRESANKFLVSDAERIVAYLTSLPDSSARETYQTIREAFQAHVYASKDAFGLFAVSFMGSDDNDATDVTEAVSWWKASHGENGLRELAAMGNIFSTQFPHVAAEVERQITAMIIAQRRDVIRFPKRQFIPIQKPSEKKVQATVLPRRHPVEDAAHATSRKIHIVEGQSHATLHKTLIAVDRVLQNIQAVSSTPSGPISPSTEALIRKKVDTLCARDIDAVLARCDQLQKETHEYQHDEVAFEYQLIGAWLKEKYRELEQRAIEEFLTDKYKLLEAAEKMEQYVVASDSYLQPSRNELIKRSIEKIKHFETYVLLGDDFLLTLWPHASFHAPVIALARVLRDRLASLKETS